MTLAAQICGRSPSGGRSDHITSVSFLGREENGSKRFSRVGSREERRGERERDGLRVVPTAKARF